jgi:CDP-diacylglycerol--glycerol-3-phosphate 3-phosphatidyltransferase
MVPIFTIFIEFNDIYSITTSIIIFLIAAFTDLIDGKIARERQAVTVLGIFLDPLADKLLISTALIYFAIIPNLRIQMWMIIIIISRDFLITGLRYTLVNRNIVMPANTLGKFKTVIQIICIIVIMLIIIINKLTIKLNNIFPIVFILYNRYLLYILFLIKLPLYIIIVVILFTIISGFTYIWEYRDIFNEK